MTSVPAFLRQGAKALPPLKRLTGERDQLSAKVAEQKLRIAALERLVVAEGANQLWPAGHFYSPVPSLVDVARFDADGEQASASTTIPGIDLNAAGQLAIVRQLGQFYSPEDLPDEPQPGRRYYCDNDFFSYADAVMLQAMLRLTRPQRIVEVGSGFSSALILDVRDAFLTPATHCTFIEPNPERLELLLSTTDREYCEIIESPVQDVSRSIFDALDANDILFIDSSHVSKLASDVNLLVLSILPLLKPGVFVHIHDIFYPFEYPEAWVHEGRSWNESYLIRAFLEFNEAFEVIVFNSYLRRFHCRLVADSMPLWERGHGGSLWLKRRLATE
jgi:predicted O-methyltransferase YrrM